MTFPKYPEYKNSGVEWLGEVPVHWCVSALKRGYDVILGKMLQPEPKKESDQLLPYLRAANIQPKGVDLTDVKKMWFSPSEARQLTLEYGDLLISEGGDVGRPALWSSGPGYHIQNSINRVRPKANNSAHFLFYWILAIKQKGYVDVLCNKSTIAHFTAEKVAGVPTPFPPGSEQQAIATFLDYETARIDALVEEQQRLIELLKEKRQAVISHAVTKGLNPNVPMKDSGVKWLGEMPEHWEVKRVKHVVRTFEQGWSPQCENVPVQTADEWGVLKVGCVNNGVFRSSENKKLPQELQPNPELAVRAGDILISRANTRELVGSCAVPTVDVPNLMISDKLFRLRLKKNSAHPRFIAFFMGTAEARNLIELEATGASSSMLNIGQRTVLEMEFPCPPLDEQTKIQEQVINQTWQLLDLAGQAIELKNRLEERRSALISAAVTGKIDVRGWQPPLGLSESRETADEV
ncbi:restriction endonuclease subunit S [Vreelandella alkaliphila]|uniref:restriction endonuclease subunit S n=1 Tax=Vreelandella alkaliphila TaxID=272774 RepID=UPI003FD8E965